MKITILFFLLTVCLSTIGEAQNSPTFQIENDHKVLKTEGIDTTYQTTMEIDFSSVAMLKNIQIITEDGRVFEYVNPVKSKSTFIIDRKNKKATVAIEGVFQKLPEVIVVDNRNKQLKAAYRTGKKDDRFASPIKTFEPDSSRYHQLDKHPEYKKLKKTN